MMATIGFLFVLLLGGAFIFAGVVANVLSGAFSGKYSIEGCVFMAIGLVVIYFAFDNSPISLVMKGGL